MSSLTKDMNQAINLAEAFIQNSESSSRLVIAIKYILNFFLISPPPPSEI